MSLRKRVPWASNLLGFGLAQGVVALGAILRIPVILSLASLETLANLMIAISLSALVLAISDGIAQAARVEASLEHGRNRQLRVFRNSVAEGYFFAVLGMTSIMIALAIILGGDVNSTVVLFLFLIAGTTPAIAFASHKGFLEASGKTALVSVFQSSSTVLGLPLTIVALVLDGSGPILFFIVGFSNAIPYLMCFVYFLVIKGKSKAVIAVALKMGPTLKSATTMIFWSASGKLSNAFDALAISTFVGTTAAALYGVESRVMVLGMIASLSLSAYVNNEVNEAESRNSSNSVLRVVRVWTAKMSVLGLVFGTLATLIMPVAVNLLTDGSLHYDFVLTLWLFAYAFLSAISVPILSLYSTPERNMFRASLSVTLALINIGMSFLLSKAVGIHGPVIASFICLLMLVGILLLHLLFIDGQSSMRLFQR